MVVFPNAKINIGLYITGKRPDGYHDLLSFFYPLMIHDALEIVPGHEVLDDIRFNSSGLAVSGKPDDNLCARAYRMLKADHPHLPAIDAHLLKKIPMGAGLGGGSADGSFMLMMLNRYFQLNIPESALFEYALRLGSDCPFFILNKPAIVRGRGETLIPFHIDLSGYRILVVNPGIHVPTGWAFSQVKPRKKNPPLEDWLKMPVISWKKHIENDFFEPVAAKYPEIRSLHDAMYGMGAVFASMSGSGSTVFGLFPKEQNPTVPFPPGYFQKWI